MLSRIAVASGYLSRASQQGSPTTPTKLRRMQSHVSIDLTMMSQLVLSPPSGRDEAGKYLPLRPLLDVVIVVSTSYRPTRNDGNFPAAKTEFLQLLEKVE